MAMATTVSSKECAVVGVGVLGSSLCRQLLLLEDWKVTGITKSTARHEDILEQVDDTTTSSSFTLTTADEIATSSKKFPYCVFCAPPSGFDDYGGAVEEAMTNLWDKDAGGSFIFTSSGGIYGPGDANSSSVIAATVNEDSPLPSVENNPRSAKLQKAEEAVRKNGGTINRLAGLYTLDRGAHNFWMGKDEVGGRADGIINLLHYDDAAGSVVAALQADPSVVKGKTFLISDGNPLTRQQICESTVKSKKYSGMAIPKFGGSDEDPLGKIYDGSATNAALNWKPRYS
ncbi:MAG: hypothetical protein SGARI_004696, partial [Bacillariaceae sp.]